MKKSEIFELVVSKVCEICEVSKDSVIMGVKSQDVVDARVLAVQYLRRIGFSNDEIATFFIKCKSGKMDMTPDVADIKKKAKAVDKMVCAYSGRCLESYMFCLMSEEIARYCRDTYKTMYLAWMKPPPKSTTK